MIREDKIWWAWVAVAAVVFFSIMGWGLTEDYRRSISTDFSRMITVRSVNGQVWIYARATNPKAHSEGFINFYLPDGTEVVVADGLMEIKKIAEKP